MEKQHFVTTALTYANGPLHLGHLVEQIQADIWVRFLRLQGNKVVFVSGSDAHGTPIMIAAQKHQTTPEVLVKDIQHDHAETSKKFDVAFDVYHSTHSAENHQWVQRIYAELSDNNLLEKCTIEQAYDDVKGMFLPDRFIKGTCPKCKATDQYGDHCDVCGSTHDPLAMIDPKSVLSNSIPVTRSSEHIFFKLSAQQEALKNWFQVADLQPECLNKLQEWFSGGLKSWDITRDAPYFGYPIPNEKDKYFYVWLDAPIGYIAALEYMHQKGLSSSVEGVWGKESDTLVTHFVGKDIQYFHGLFWPAVLMGAGLKAPDCLNIHGFLTINGAKMSKSKGTFVSAKQYLEDYDPEYLRYYLASKLGRKVSDIDLNWDDFIQKNNADLIGNVINIGSRSSSFVHRWFEGRLAKKLENTDIFKKWNQRVSSIEQAYQDKNLLVAMREIMNYADDVNRYFDEKKPWQMIKDPAQKEEVHQVVTLVLNAFKALIILLSPVLPRTAERVRVYMGDQSWTWASLEEVIEDRAIEPFGHLMTRIKAQKTA